MGREGRREGRDVEVLARIWGEMWKRLDELRVEGVLDTGERGAKFHVGALDEVVRAALVSAYLAGKARGQGGMGYPLWSSEQRN